MMRVLRPGPSLRRGTRSAKKVSEEVVISAYLNFTRFGLWAQLQQALSTAFPLASPALPVMLFDVTPEAMISITLLAYWKVERYLNWCGTRAGEADMTDAEPGR